MCRNMAKFQIFFSIFEKFFKKKENIQQNIMVLRNNSSHKKTLININTNGGKLRLTCWPLVILAIFPAVVVALFVMPIT